MTDSMKTTSALALIPKTIDEAASLAERLAKSTLLPKAMQGKMPDVLVTILAGQEMGLSPMASLRNFHVIEGKPVLGADGMVALVLGSGKAQYFERVEESETSVTYETLRLGAQKPKRCTWTMKMAKDAALTSKDNWRLYPRAMMAARAKSELARDVYPDVLAGCYTDDEITDFERPPAVVRHADAIDADFTEVTEPPEIAQIDTFEDETALKAFAATLKEKVPESHRAKANERYKDRLAFLRGRARDAQHAQSSGVTEVEAKAS